MIFFIDADSEAPAETADIAFPLTYDEEDSSGLTWDRQGDGPHVTPDGFAGDGVLSRYRASVSLPEFVTSTSGPLTLHATVVAAQGPRISTGDTICAVCENDSDPRPKLGLYVTADTMLSTELNVSLRGYTSSLQTEPLYRGTWRYEFRFPELDSDGDLFTPQGLHIIDADTMLVSAYRDTSNLSRVYKTEMDGTVLGYFDFSADDIDPGFHINAITQAPDGSYWMAGSQTMFEVDVAASLLSNAAVILTRYSLVNVQGSFLDIKNIDGTDYVLTGQYLESGSPYLYIFPFVLVTDGGTFDVADRTKRYFINQRVQGVNYHGGKLYATLNRTTSEGSGSRGYIHRIPLDLSAADNTTIASPDGIWAAPSAYPEDLDFQGDRLYVSSEGRTAVRSDYGWLAVFSSPLDGTAQTNHVTAEYDGSVTTIKINNALFVEKSWALTPTPGCIVVGGPPQASPGQDAGFFIGHVRDIVIQDSALTEGQYAYAIAGSHEPNTLTSYTLSISNTGADVDATTGWTTENGGLGRRTTNPSPHSGAGYFSGGTSANTLSRQRFDISTVTGLSTAAIDALIASDDIWIRANWWQASFDAINDTGSMGIRYLDATPTEISRVDGEQYAMSPSLTWVERGLSFATPAGSRNVDLLQRMDRTSGTNNDVYIDDISAVIYARP